MEFGLSQSGGLPSGTLALSILGLHLPGPSGFIPEINLELLLSDRLVFLKSLPDEGETWSQNVWRIVDTLSSQKQRFRSS